MNDLITIIINAYNEENFIIKCVNSVINQTYKNLEILIINDGSTDNTLKLCKSIKDKRIRIITTKNLGLSLSRNIGIENAKGEYLYFIDADDFIEEDTIEYLYNLCKKYNSKLSTCMPKTIFDYNFIKTNKKEKIKVLNNKEMLKKILLSENGATAIWNKLINKNLFDGIRFQDRIINDIAFTHKLAIKLDKVIYSNQKKYYFLKHKNSITSKKNISTPARTIDYYNAILERYYEVKKVYPKLIENDIGLLRGILQLYISDNDIDTFFKEKDTYKLFRKVFSFKMLFAHIRIKEKIKILLFIISPKIYRKLGTIYRKKYKYKI